MYTFHPYLYFIITFVRKLTVTSNIRALCCGESWNSGGDLFSNFLEFTACFCLESDVCAAYNMTTSKLTYSITYLVEGMVLILGHDL